MSERRPILIPLSAEDDCWAVLTATWPLSDDAWEQMLALLYAMKPGLVDERRRRGAGGQESDDA